METDNKQITGKERKDIFALFFIAFGVVYLGLLAQYLIFIGYSFANADIGISISMGINDNVFEIPLGKIFDSLVYITLIYAGGQSALSFVKSGIAPKGELQRMPYYKFVRLRWIIGLWILGIILTTVFQMLTAKPTVIDFYMSETYSGFGMAISTYVTAYLAPKAGENINFHDISKQFMKVADAAKAVETENTDHPEME